MIEAISLACPKATLDRSGYDPVQLAAFERVTGIRKTRRTDESTLCLAERACRPLDTRWVRAVVVVSQGEPIAASLHAVLGLEAGIPAIDVNHACAGFVYGLWLGSHLSDRTLLVCVDKLRGTPGTTTDLIFSDGAVAAILKERRTGVDAERFAFATDGSGRESLYVGRDGILNMDGAAVFDFVTRKVPAVIAQVQPAMRDPFIEPQPILVQHQSNLSMMESIERKTELSGPKCITEYGNMASASVGAAIAVHHEQLKGTRDRVVLCGYGAGWSAAAVMTWLPNWMRAYIEEFE